MDRQSLGAAGNPSDFEIEDLLIKREQARIKRDFATADGIRDELRSRGGIMVDDKQRTWTAADGRSGKRPSAYDKPGHLPGDAC